ncbi:hypothetical protein AGMMS49938_07350 [Fibrobacterales bacterium]|nr:hypothetical protein AGMMS49938_07350 [Fibrobacterales bacterium]
MNNTIFLDTFIARTVIGIYPEERSNRQAVEITVSFDYDFGDATHNDDITFAVDYAVLKEELQAFVEGSHFNLLETLTCEIAKKILLFSNRVLSASVKCKKVAVGVSAFVCLSKL